MKKISKLAGIVAAAALLCGISGCDNTETITFTSASIEMVGDPVKTDKAVVFQWKDSVANNVLVTRQAPGEEEVTLRTPYNEEDSLNWFADRVSYENQLKAGVEYTYRFYNISDVSSARTTEYTLEKKFSCVERKVTFDSIAPAGTKLAPITEEQVKIVKSEANGDNYVSIYVDEKEAVAWIDIYDNTIDEKYTSLYNQEIGGVASFKYNPSHTYKIVVGKWWPDSNTYNVSDYRNNWYSGTKYYDADETEKTFDLGVQNNHDLEFEISGTTFDVRWSGEKDSTYEVSFEAFDNKGNAVTLKSSKIAASAIKSDVFGNYQVTGKVSDLVTLDATTNKTSVKTAKVIVKETAKDGTVSVSETEENIYAYYTPYTEVTYFSVTPKYDTNGDNQYITATVSVYGENLPDTAKLYYKLSTEQLYKEIKDAAGKDGLKKSGYSLTATFAEGVLTEGRYYDFKAVVTVDNAKLYDWEEGKTEEVQTKSVFIN